MAMNNQSWIEMAAQWLSAIFSSSTWSGIIGSFGALLWLEGHWLRKLALVILGSVSAFYFGGWVEQVSGLDPKLAGFIVGLFGMTVLDSIFKSWTEIRWAKIFNDWLRKRLGLPPQGD